LGAPFVFTDAVEFETLTFGRFYLLIIGLNTAPPHIALIFNNSYYSSTVAGFEQKKMGKDFILRLSKKRSLALIELEMRASQLKPDIFFESYGPLTAGASCLSPINDFIKDYYKISWKQPFLHGLLTALYNHQLVVRVQICGAPPENAIIPAYGQDSIDGHIQQLKA
jgi:hypothetical protein